MDSDVLVILVVVIGGLAFATVVALAALARMVRNVEPGHALIVVRPGRSDVSFTGMLVVPVVSRADVMDIRGGSVVIDRRGKEGVNCRDNIRADIRVKFSIRINKTAEDVLKVAETVGAARASDPQTLADLFTAKFSEAMKSVAKQLNFEELVSMQDEFSERLVDVIGMDLNGYVLDDAAIEYLEQTSIEALDPANILDAQGIRKITTQTSEASLELAQIRTRNEMRLAELELQAKEIAAQIERQQALILEGLEKDTGRKVTLEELDGRLSMRLREMVELVVSERLERGKRAGVVSDPPPANHARP